MIYILFIVALVLFFLMMRMMKIERSVVQGIYSKMSGIASPTRPWFDMSTDPMEFNGFNVDTDTMEVANGWIVVWGK